MPCLFSGSWKRGGLRGGRAGAQQEASANKGGGGEIRAEREMTEDVE